MSLYYPSIILPHDEAAKKFNCNISFDKNGYMKDNNLHIQKRMEDIYGQVIIFVTESTQHEIIIFFEPTSVVQTNIANGKRLAVIQGDADYIISTIKTMIARHPNEKPEVIISSYAFQCNMNDKLAIREWTKKTYNCI